MTVHSAITGYRELRPAPKGSRAKCPCCGKKASHGLWADGAIMGNGCEIFGWRWVKDARSAFASLHRLKRLEKPE